MFPSLWGKPPKTNLLMLMIDIFGNYEPNIVYLPNFQKLVY